MKIKITVAKTLTRNGMTTHSNTCDGRNSIEDLEESCFTDFRMKISNVPVMTLKSELIQIHGNIFSN